MKTLAQIYGVDKALAEDGAWIEFEGGFAIKMRRLQSAKSIEAFRDLANGEDISVFLAKMHLPENRPLRNKWLAKGVAVDWRGAYDQEGDDYTPIPFSAERCLEAFEAFEDMADVAWYRVQQREHFQENRTEHTAGNSPDSSAGSSAGDQTQAAASS